MHQRLDVQHRVQDLRRRLRRSFLLEGAHGLAVAVDQHRGQGQSAEDLQLLATSTRKPQTKREKYGKMDMGQHQTTRGPQVLVRVSICQGSNLGTYFDPHPNEQS